MSLTLSVSLSPSTSLSLCLFSYWLSLSYFVRFSLRVCLGSVSFAQDSPLQDLQLGVLDMLGLWDAATRPLNTQSGEAWTSMLGGGLGGE